MTGRRVDSGRPSKVIFEIRRSWKSRWSAMTRPQPSSYTAYLLTKDTSSPVGQSFDGESRLGGRSGASCTQNPVFYVTCFEQHITWKRLVNWNVSFLRYAIVSLHNRHAIVPENTIYRSTKTEQQLLFGRYCTSHPSTSTAPHAPFLLFLLLLTPPPLTWQTSSPQQSWCRAPQTLSHRSPQSKRAVGLHSDGSGWHVYPGRTALSSVPGRSEHEHWHHDGAVSAGTYLYKTLILYILSNTRYCTVYWVVIFHELKFFIKIFSWSGVTNKIYKHVKLQYELPCTSRSGA